MNLTMLAAAGVGAVLAAGLVCLAVGLRRRPIPQPGTRPPSRSARLRAAATDRRRLRRGLAALAAGIVVLAVSGWPVAGLAAAAATLWLPGLMSARAARTRIARLDALEQWTRKIADTLGASRGLEQALRYSTRGCPKVIEEPVARLAGRLAVGQAPAEQALREFAAELDDPVADSVAAALILAAALRGPGLHAVLTATAANLARTVAAHREAEAERAGHRTAMRWITLILLGSIGWLTLLQHQYFAVYTSLFGEIVLAVVAGVFAAGLWWMARLGTPALGQRFLDQQPAGGKEAAR